VLIREECERFFCESMKAVFPGEGDAPTYGSGAMSVAGVLTPPDDDPFPSHYSKRLVTTTAYPTDQASVTAAVTAAATFTATTAVEVSAWLEVWDYVGGASVRAFVARSGSDKTLFAFLDASSLERELKAALVALIEIAEDPLGCSSLVLCVDRSIPDAESKELLKSLGWVGFEVTGLGQWIGGRDITSKRWLFLGMEV